MKTILRSTLTVLLTLLLAQAAAADSASISISKVFSGVDTYKLLGAQGGQVQITTFQGAKEVDYRFTFTDNSQVPPTLLNQSLLTITGFEYSGCTPSVINYGVDHEEIIYVLGGTCVLSWVSFSN